MQINLNSALSDQLPPPLALVERPLFYGDALFESMRVFNGRIPFFEQHWARLSEGMQRLGFELPEHWNQFFFQQEIQKLNPVNARLRLTVWRSVGGLYLPENDTPNFLITGRALDAPAWEWPDSGLTLGLCRSVRLPVDTLSGLKTLNAPRYTAAAREAKRAGWDDGLLLNGYDAVCEAVSSNVFWWEGENLFTVPLSDGCVAGVFRNALVVFGRATGHVVREKSVTFAGLLQADEIFLTNAVRGILPAGIFDGRPLATRRTKQLFDAFSAWIAT